MSTSNTNNDKTISANSATIELAMNVEEGSDQNDTFIENVLQQDLPTGSSTAPCTDANTITSTTTNSSSNNNDHTSRDTSMIMIMSEAKTKVTATMPLSFQSDEFQDNPSSSSSAKSIESKSTPMPLSMPSSTSTKNSKSTLISSSSLLDSAIQEEEEEQLEQLEQQSENNQPSHQSINTMQPKIAIINNNNDNDNDTKVATQMAAVAALVTAATRENKIGNSPSVAATYVKDLISSDHNILNHNNNDSTNTGTSNANNNNNNNATIVMGMKRNENDTGSKTKNNHHNNRKINHNVIVPVHLHLVQQYLSSIEKDNNDRSAITTATTTTTNGNMDMETKDTAIINDSDENLKDNDFIKKDDQNEEEKSYYTDSNNNKKNATKMMMLFQQMQNNNGDNNIYNFFLKQLLTLTHHTCIDDVNGKESDYDNEQQNQNSNDNNNNSSKNMTNIDEERAKIAALKVLRLLEQIDSSFSFLFSHLPSSTLTSISNTTTSYCTNHNHHGSTSSNNSIRKEKSKVMKDDDDNNVGLEDYDPTTTFHREVECDDENNKENDDKNETDDSTFAIHDHNDNHNYESVRNDIDHVHSTIPDLLPSCMPDEGDVTNYFFKCCEAVQKIPSSSSQPKKIDENRTSDDETVATSKSTSTTSSSLTSTRNHAASMFSSVLSTVKTAGIVKGRRIRNKAKNLTHHENDQDDETGGGGGGGKAVVGNKSTSDQDYETSTLKSNQVGLDYKVVIESEMLGLTVENVLERTVVRTVLAQGAAKKAGTKIGSLIVKVGSVETANFTHFETIDELRQSKRPLRLVLRKIGKDALKGARDEMGRLIKGGGFGNSVVETGISRNYENDSDGNQTNKHEDGESKKEYASTIQTYTLQDDAFCNFLQERWIEGAKLNTTSKAFTKKEETLSKAGAKLTWLLSLLILGMEKEAEKLTRDDSSKTIPSHYSADDYIDAAKSVSKVLHDYVQTHFTRGTKAVAAVASIPAPPPMAKKRAKQMPPAHIQDRQRNAVPGASRRNPQQSLLQSSPASSTETALLKIGDVLHRTRSFLADPHSPPAALLRGELIALLCDILDLDTDMALSEQEGASSTAGRRGGAINDLGSAGSLLKLIVLNCSVMRSIGCIDDDSNCHSLHAGNRFLAVVHRLAASRSSSARVTACSLGPVLWGHLDFPHQLQLRGVITRALHDSDVTVRKSTAIVLHEIAELVFDSRAVPWLVLMCERAMTDPEPQLRAAAMTLTFHLAEHLPNAFFGDAREGSRSRRRLPQRTDPAFAEVYLLQCKLLPVATRLAEDVSAPVRLAVAAQCDRLANALGGHWHSVIIDLLQALLGDKDESVRAEAALCIPRLAEIVLLDNSNGTGSGVTVLESLLPLAIKLLKDTSVDVRSALATAAGEMLTLLVGFQSCEEVNVFEASPICKEKERSSYKKHIDDTLIPLLQKLLQDSNPEVTSSALRAITNTSRGNVREISNRRNEDDSISLSSSHQSHAFEKKDPVFIPVLSEEQVLRLVPTLSKLANSGQWRVRQSAVEIVPALLGCTQKLEIRTEIAQLCVTLMSDGVDAVRKTAAECLCLGGNSVGDGNINSQEWIQSVVMPHVEACRDSPKSKQRLLSLKMVEIILSQGLCYSGSKIVEHIVNPSNNESNTSTSTSLIRKNLEVLELLSSDDTANVRLNVGRVVSNIIGTLDEDDLNFIINALDSQLEVEQSQSSGGDRDVIFFAKRAKKLAQERLRMLKNL